MFLDRRPYRGAREFKFRPHYRQRGGTDVVRVVAKDGAMDAPVFLRPDSSDLQIFDHIFLTGVYNVHRLPRQHHALHLGESLRGPRRHRHRLAAQFVEDRLARVIGVVEKPSPSEAPSNLAAIGRYVLTPEIFECIRAIEPGVAGEVQLTDAINLLAQQQAVYAWVFEGGRFDVGNKLDYLKATIELAIDRDDVGADLGTYLVDLVQRKKLL